MDESAIKNKQIIQEKIKKMEQTLQREEKESLACKVAAMVKNGQTIGFGSGSTSFIAVEKIAEIIKRDKINITAVPTSDEIANLCKFYGIETKTLNETKLDWAFDGTDEVDQKKNLIKGKGKCMFREKLNFLNAPKVYILADESKYVANLGESIAIPVECYIGAAEYVMKKLVELGATKCELVKSSDGKIELTDLNNCIIAAKFYSENINRKLEDDMKLITGVIETGLFYGYKNLEIL